MLRVEVLKHRPDFTLDARIEIPTPGTMALFGRSGCGKTTLVNVISGLLRADHALIDIDGITLEDTRSKVRVPVEQRRIGYVFQESRLFPHLDVTGNLRYGSARAPAGSRVVEFDHVVQLLGLSAMLKRRAFELSGGERQRVALGRALLSQPRLMLLDEPLAALDTPRREEVLPYLERLRDEFSIPMVYVSHRFDEVLRLATHVVVMDQGKVAVQGPIETVSRHPALRAIVGDEAIGSVLNGVIESTDPQTGLTSVRVGDGLLHVNLRSIASGSRVRVHLLARDVILATQPVEGLSVRNSVQGTIARIVAEDQNTDMVEVDIGGPIVLARLTRAASSSLALRPGQQVWALVKAVSIRGHAFLAPTS
jgi:molybdate transport system ATP-binding protein